MPKPDKSNLPVPLSDYLSDMIAQDGDHGNVAQWLLAVRMAEKVEIPTGHNKIIEAINHSQEVLVSMIEHQVMMTVAKLTMETIDEAEKAIEKELASEPPSDESAETVTEGRFAAFTANLKFFEKLIKLVIDNSLSPSEETREAIAKVIDDLEASLLVTYGPEGAKSFCQELRDIHHLPAAQPPFVGPDLKDTSGLSDAT